MAGSRWDWLEHVGTHQPALDLRSIGILGLKKNQIESPLAEFWWGVYPTPPLICGKLYCSVFSNSTLQPISNLIVNRNGMLAAKIWLVGWWFQFFNDDVLSSWAVLFLTTARMLLHGSAMLISRSAEVLWRAIHQQLSVVRLHLRIGREKLQETTLWH